MSKKLRKFHFSYKNEEQYLLKGTFLKFKNLFFDKNEKFFLNYITNKNKKKEEDPIHKKVVLVQMIDNHYFLAHAMLILQNKRFLNCELVGIWPHFSIYKPGRYSLLRFVINYIEHQLRKRKWIKLYKQIGINTHFSLNDNFMSYLAFSRKYFVKKNLGNISKSKINSIRYENIPIGNTIYDTYLRYFNKVTFNQNDVKIIKYILYLTENSFRNLNLFYKKNNKKIYCYLTSGHTYIQNSIPLKFFVKKKINVWGGTKTNSYLINYNKNINGMYFEDYKKIFDKLKFKKTKIKVAKKFIFSSNSNFLTRKFNTKKIKKLKKKLDIIIFLPDFVDSPHGKGWLLFNDFSEWIEETLNFLINRNLSIGVKPQSYVKIFQSNL